jgi:protein-S-isoprenylcysteine O-methyltransferase Ste14
MIYALLGMVGFAVLSLFDVACAKGMRYLKSLSWLLGSSLVGYSLIMASIKTSRVDLPIYIRYLGWVLSTVALGLLIYSLFIEIPLKIAYIGSSPEPRLVTKGTYSLVRHPWFIWFVFFVAALFVATGSKILLVSLLAWGAVNLLRIFAQDRYLYPLMFGQAYREYKKKTPMLIPNRDSLRKFLTSLKDQSD